MDKTINMGPRPLAAASSPGPTPTTLFCRDIGTGPAVVLLHGFAEDGATWDNLADPLSAHCRLIIPDLPAIHSIEDLAATIASLLDHLGIDKCIMIGHSMGGYITLAFAEKYPDRLTALGLFHSTAYPDNEEKKAVRRKSIDFIRKNGADLFIRQSTPGLFGQYTHQHHPELIDAMIDRYINFPPDTLIAWYQAMIRRPDRTAVLREFYGPVLFIIGKEDTIVPLQSSLEQSHLPAVSHIHLIKNTGHEGMHEAPPNLHRYYKRFHNICTTSMNKTIFITGATSGFGEACARKFAAAGDHLILTGRRKDRLDALKRELESPASAVSSTPSPTPAKPVSPSALRVLCLNFDVQDRAAVFAAVDSLPPEWRKIDILINNAGLALGRDYFDEASLEDWETMINTNVKGLLYVSRAVLPLLIPSGNGHIINLGSVAGKEVYEKGNVYCGSKFAVDAISRSMRIDMLRHGIKVTAIHPGAAETEFSKVRFKGDEGQAKKIYEGYTPLSAEDVADAIFYCASLPPHVCINDLVITCKAQADAIYFYKG